VRCSANAVRPAQMAGSRVKEPQLCAAWLAQTDLGMQGDLSTRSVTAS